MFVGQSSVVFTFVECALGWLFGQNDVVFILSAIFISDRDLLICKEDILLFQMATVIILEMIWHSQKKKGNFYAWNCDIREVIDVGQDRIVELSSKLCRPMQERQCRVQNKVQVQCVPPLGFVKINMDISVRDGWTFAVLVVRDVVRNILMVRSNK